jgi:hypothetical protein
LDEIQALAHGFNVALTPTNIALMFTGVILGVIIGVLPGLGGANGVAILLPLTFGMAQTPGGATSAIILLSCIYWGALFGGAITSILSTSRRALVGGDYLRRLSARAAGGKGTALTAAPLVLRRRVRRGDRDHVPVAGGRGSRWNWPARFFAVPADVLRSSAPARSAVQDHRRHDARLRARRGGHRHVTGRCAHRLTHLLTGFDFLRR